MRIFHKESPTGFWDHGPQSWDRNYNSIHWSSIPSCSIYMQPKLLKRKRFESRHKKIWNRPTVPCAVPTGLKSSLHNEFLCLKIPHTCHWCGITLSSSANFGKTKWAPTREENLSILRSLSPYHGQNTRPHEKGLLQEKKNLQNLLVVGFEPCVSLAESVLTTGLFQIWYTNVFVII